MTRDKILQYETVAIFALKHITINIPNPWLHVGQFTIAKITIWLKFSGNFILKSFKSEPTPGEPGTCPEPGLNQRPSDLQSDALPTELSRPARMGPSEVITNKAKLLY